ncbi:hypothetical protein CYMTET_36999 [Cymbomonas tetramitiformis]|uniref:RING-type domain-containing protein n=1 Tax=Cymbomonas tetramitiformis TaxID=36881 RepID=A0AAE0CEV5_9CHLO|nr:hypothetical protein CYMTET_36999 [Cymbomonas tetramitiformis]
MARSNWLACFYPVVEGQANQTQGQSAETSKITAEVYDDIAYEKFERFQCVLCKDTVKEPQLLRECGHTSFCRFCINAWLKNTKKCPICLVAIENRPVLNFKVASLVEDWVGQKVLDVGYERQEPLAEDTVPKKKQRSGFGGGMKVKLSMKQYEEHLKEATQQGSEQKAYFEETKDEDGTRRELVLYTQTVAQPSTTSETVTLITDAARIRNLTVWQLKDQCRIRGIPRSGNKAELQDKLLAYVPT